MDLPSKHVYDILMQNGVNELFHANSVITACQFIKSRSLMSRGTLERLGITQTPQKSDDLDKRYGVWFDVFLDSVDIHKRASRANSYGPVLFVLDTKIIDKTYTGRLWVTKLNPTKWSGKSQDQRWFQDKHDLSSNFVRGCFDQMIVVRHNGGELPFRTFLKEIVVDDPARVTSDNVDFYSMTVGALRSAMQQAGLNTPISRRRCSKTCSCQADWANDTDRLFQMFDPKAE